MFDLGGKRSINKGVFGFMKKRRIARFNASMRKCEPPYKTYLRATHKKY